MKKKFCYTCGKEISTDINNTSSHRTDGYCTAKCKRRDRFGELKEAQQKIALRFKND